MRKPTKTEFLSAIGGIVLGAAATALMVPTMVAERIEVAAQAKLDAEMARREAQYEAAVARAEQVKAEIDARVDCLSVGAVVGMQQSIAGLAKSGAGSEELLGSMRDSLEKLQTQAKGADCSPWRTNDGSVRIGDGDFSNMSNGNFGGVSVSSDQQ